MATPVTESWLGEIGGWQAMKAARDYVRLGSVSEVTQDGRTYRGLVGSGARKFRATLIAGEGRNADAKCACPDAQRGLVCAHALAVALAAINPGLAPARSGSAAGDARPSAVSGAGAGQGSSVTGRAASGRAASGSPAKPEIPAASFPPGQFTVHIATEHLPKAGGGSGAGGGPKGKAAPASVPVFLKFEPGGEHPDLAISRWLAERGMPVGTSPLRLPLAELGSLLEALVDHSRVLSGVPSQAQNTQKDTISKQTLLVTKELHINIHSERNSSFDRIVLESVASDYQALDLQNSPWFWSPSRQAFAALPGDLPPGVLTLVLSLLQTGKAVQSLRRVAEYLPALRQVINPENEDDPLHRLRLLPAQPVFRLRLEGNLMRLEAHLAPLLPDGSNEASPAAYPVPDPQDPFVFLSRNPAAERAAQRRLEDAGFSAVGTAGGTRGPGSAPAANSTVYELKGDREILRFLSSDLPRFRREFQVVEGEGWRNVTRGLTIIRPKVRPPSPGMERGLQSASADAQAPAADWLSLEVAYEAPDGFRIPRAEVLRLIRSGKRDVTGQGGRRYLLDADGCEELEDMVQDMESHFEAGSRLAVRSRQAEVLEGFIDRPDVLALHLVPPLDPAALKSRLGGLGDMLRPYQLEGVRWMERHSRTGGGGILADEMGLGKTVQTLALLRVLRASDLPPSPALIVCPTSLLNNWAEEAARFTPELRTHISHDSDRHEALENLSGFDVIFTSYALIVRDLPAYLKQEFSAVVLDEASYIRNPDTATAKAVRQLRAGCRFALTGTPVENSVRDLWSLFAFLVPGQLPPREDFQARFVKPLAQADAAQARPVMERLRRLIRPNLLRRTKREVAKDLPEKIEKVLWCDLSGPQAEIYRRLLDEGREEIRQARRRAGQGSARMTMFTVLLRLRQVCNDLRLVGVQGFDGLSPAERSGKWPVLEELLQETLEGGHKALIFSQFVSMLRLVREKVTADGTAHSYLDGATRDRASEVAAFQSEADRRLFLISLKAGGYGLNLTAADEVILIDPWWNPAVEAQAIDRAHRIGQGRPVTAYRLVTRGTVEEKILKLQSQKRAVMDMTLVDDPTVLAGLTDAELEAMVLGE